MPNAALVAVRRAVRVCLAMALVAGPAACGRPAEGPDGPRVVTTSLGAVEPLVEVTVFCDYQCPECRRTERVLTPLLTHFPVDVAIRYRAFPLVSVHPLARDAAVYVLAATRQGGFGCIHRMLVTRQDDWTSDTPADFRTRVAGFAVACGLDAARFEADAGDAALAREVDADTALARDLEAPGTPTILVHGLKPERWAKPGVATRDLLVPTLRRELQAAEALLAGGAARRDIPRLLTAKRRGEAFAGQLFGAF